MKVSYLNDELKEMILKGEFYLDCYYKIGSEGNYVYYMRLGDLFEMCKINIDDYNYDKFVNVVYGEADFEMLVDIFNQNISFCNKENKFYDYEEVDFGKIILDDYNKIIGFEKDC